MTASPSPAVRSGGESMTEDGWGISFERVLLVLGRASLDGDGCSTYSEARYTRVLSLVGAPDGQKISESFALGHCDFGFGVTNAESDSLLGTGASAEDLQFLRTLGTDRYAGASGISLFVQGEARKGEVRKTFAWAFRQRVRYTECGQVVNGVRVRGLTLGQSDDVTVEIVLHPEALFADAVEPTTAKLRFDAIADADTTLGNADGEVTLGELAQSPLAGLDPPYDVGDTGAALLTLEDFVYLGVAPMVARYRDDGTCTLRLGQMRGN